jgi:hypothetical protein
LRLRKGYLSFLTFLALLLVLVPLAGLGSANHGSIRLEISPEPAAGDIGDSVTLTAKLVNNSGALQTAGSGGIAIDWEIEGVTNNPEGDTVEAPDRTCTVPSGASTCEVDFTSPVAGRMPIRAWIDHDKLNEVSGGITEADRTEARYSGPTAQFGTPPTNDCDFQNEPTDDTFGCPSDSFAAGSTTERDDTDVNVISWGAEVARLDCDDETGNDRDTNPRTLSESYTCLVTDQFGNPKQDIRVDAEVQGANDPDERGFTEAGNTTADYTQGTEDQGFPEFCRTGASGQCTATISGNVRGGETGTALVCFWVDEGPVMPPSPNIDNEYSPTGSEKDGGLCDTEAPTTNTGADAPENNNITDKARITWRDLANTQLLSEGTTKSGWTSFLLLGNTSLTHATVVNVTFLTENGAVAPPSTEEMSIPPGGRTTIDVNQLLSSTDFGVKVVALRTPGATTSDVVAEMSMHRSGSLATIDTVGISGTGTTAQSPSTTWIMPEGATHSGFSTFVDVINPNQTTDTQVNITYLTKTGGSKAHPGNPVTIPKGSRRTFDVGASCACSDDVSTRVAVVPPANQTEPAKPNVVAGMTFQKTDGGDLGAAGSVGVPGAATHWVVPEGTTAFDFKTFVLIANPGSDAATVNVDFLTPGGKIAGPQGQVIPAGSRRTVDVFLACNCTTDVSTVVAATAGTVAVESSIHKLDGTGFVIGDSVASGGGSIDAASGTRWLSAEGATHSGFATFILIANPGASEAVVDVTFLTKTGGVVQPDGFQNRSIAPGQRLTVSIDLFVPADDVSTLVTTDSGKVAVEMAIDHVIGGLGFSKGRSISLKLAG